MTAVFYQKKKKETVEHLDTIYETIDMPPQLPTIPPPLPPHQPHQIPMQDNPSYVKVDLTDNPAYESINNDTVINSASGVLTSHLGSSSDS